MRWLHGAAWRLCVCMVYASSRSCTKSTYFLVAITAAHAANSKSLSDKKRNKIWWMLYCNWCVWAVPHSTQKDFNETVTNFHFMSYCACAQLIYFHIFCCFANCMWQFYDFMADKAKIHNSEQEMWRRQCVHLFRLRTDFHLGSSHIPRYWTRFAHSPVFFLVARHGFTGSSVWTILSHRTLWSLLFSFFLFACPQMAFFICDESLLLLPKKLIDWTI